MAKFNWEEAWKTLDKMCEDQTKIDKAFVKLLKTDKSLDSYKAFNELKELIKGSANGLET